MRATPSTDPLSMKSVFATADRSTDRSVRKPARIALAVACISALFSVGASHASAADLPKETLTASDVTPFAGAIQSYIAAQVKGLVDADPAKGSKSRQGLIDEMAGLNPPSAAFADFYCGELTNQLVPLTSNSDPRVRLNIAIITARVAERAQDASGRLAPLIVAELKDTNAGVMLWAMRAARNTIAPILNVKGANNSLVPAILAAAKSTNSGAVIGAAYDALAATGPNPAALPVNIGATIQLLGFRLSQYGSSVPPEPPMDGRGTSFLTQMQIWTAQTPPQQIALVQMILDLVGAANSGYSTAQGVDRDELVTLMSSAGKALYVIGINKQDPLLQAAVTPLAQATSRMSPAALQANVNSAVNGVLNSFPKVHKPMSATTAASTPTATPMPAAMPAATATTKSAAPPAATK